MYTFSFHVPRYNSRICTATFKSTRLCYMMVYITAALNLVSPRSSERAREWCNRAVRTNPRRPGPVHRTRLHRSSSNAASPEECLSRRCTRLIEHAAVALCSAEVSQRNRVTPSLTDIDTDSKTCEEYICRNNSRQRYYHETRNVAGHRTRCERDATKTTDSHSCGLYQQECMQYTSIDIHAGAKDQTINNV